MSLAELRYWDAQDAAGFIYQIKGIHGVVGVANLPELQRVAQGAGAD
jgi:hypothetical protein